MVLPVTVNVVAPRRAPSSETPPTPEPIAPLLLESVLLVKTTSPPAPSMAAWKRSPAALVNVVWSTVTFITASPPSRLSTLIPSLPVVAPIVELLTVRRLSVPVLLTTRRLS